MEGSQCSWVVLIGCIGLVGFIIWRWYDRGQKIEKAAKNYRAGLARLKKSPGDSDLRQQTLMLGRVYARVAREGKKETLFDEVALMNDLNSVGVGTVSMEPIVTKPDSSVEQRLRSLEDLKEKGLITEDEYEQRRAKILEDI